jgi:16S rRNA (cytosine967-C5)-methyltransferase
MHSQSYLRSAISILEGYKGASPFPIYLKEQFRADKKYGSRDRKQISHLCYCYFRTGHSLERLPLEQRFILSLFLCSREPNALLEHLDGSLNEKAGMGLQEKWALLQNEYGFDWKEVFPYLEAVSGEIDPAAFTQSIFIQPDLFLRLRPGKESLVQQKLEAAGINYQKVSETTLALANGSKVEDAVMPDRDTVVQDMSSQATLATLIEKASSMKDPAVWDCCAASGGKSLLLHDLLPEAKLTVSDIRASILGNLHKRFERAGIKYYDSKLFDVSAAPLKDIFDVVICDAPCSGSGTWSRTPEQLKFFTEEKISYYSGLQKRIAANASLSVRNGGYFLYITCSVYKAENEEVVQYLQDRTDLTLVSTQYHKGFEKKADTLFTALFTVL